MRTLRLAFLFTMIALGSVAQDPQSLDRTQVEQEVMALLDKWMEAFNSLDVDAWEGTFHFPHYRLARGRMRVLNSAGEQRQGGLEDFLKKIGWHRSAWDRRRIVHLSASKVHVDTRFIRYRKDGSVIGSFESLYIVTKEDGRWGVKMRSSYSQ
jgi:hypothetical protein